MDRLGFSPDEVASQRPGIVYVSINCYGHEGHWGSRPGWEQLAQTVTGMAAQQGVDRTDGVPTLLPVAVNDYTTGYLAAFGTLVALQQRARSGGSYWVRVSLARTAMWLRNLGLRPNTGRTPFRVRPLAEAELERMSSHMDSTWGELRYLRPAVELSNVAVTWQVAPVPLGSHSPSFSSKKPE
jgi:crotonobetainyl-CoA:carnitine CoA-transferase CaiB-like acyl-CoA transferase